MQRDHKYFYEICIKYFYKSAIKNFTHNTDTPRDTQDDLCKLFHKTITFSLMRKMLRYVRKQSSPVRGCFEARAQARAAPRLESLQSGSSLHGLLFPAYRILFMTGKVPSDGKSAGANTRGGS
jgi:hypothetical protein